MKNTMLKAWNIILFKNADDIVSLTIDDYAIYKANKPSTGENVFSCSTLNNSFEADIR